MERRNTGMSSSFEPPTGLTQIVNEIAKADTGFGGRLKKRMSTIKETFDEMRDESPGIDLYRESGPPNLSLSMPWNSDDCFFYKETPCP